MASKKPSAPGEDKYRGPSITKTERDSVTDNTKAIIKRSLLSLVNNPDINELSFPTSFTNIDRKLTHSLAREYGLKSKSHGSGPKRCITVYKSVQKDLQDLLTLTPNSVGTIDRLLLQYPVDGADKEKEKNVQYLQLYDTALRLTRRSQLCGGRPSVPVTDCHRTKSFRERLPIYPRTTDILFEIETGRVILIVGETGSGKTTQVPQMIMEHEEVQERKCQIICCMPRRVAAVTISERVAFERGEQLGDTVGYQIKLESRVSHKTILTYCTSGVLLRSLLGSDAWLDRVTHVIIDEVHERDKITDFLLIVLKKALLRHKNLKLILMSATVDCEKFENYFRGFPTDQDYCRVVEVPGMMYDVRDVYLEQVLEGVNYMSPEMIALKEMRDVARFFQGNEAVATHRTSARPPVHSLEEKLAMVDPTLICEMDSILGIALNTGTTEAMKSLVGFMKSNNIPPDYQHSVCGRTALMAAAIYSDIDAVDDVIHMDPDLSVVSKEGKTALMYAEEANDSDILDLFNAYTYYCNKKKRIEAASSARPLEKELPQQTQELVEMYEKCHIQKDIDENLILCVLKIIHNDGRDGAVLVFLPGFDHIVCVRDIIMQNVNSFASRPLDIYILHSRMKSVDQKKVFDPAPPGRRKVILSTNIAETSVTIDDVRFVIDCGKVKELSYSTMSCAYTLECDWISQSCARQRRGRAGRTSEGICFRLYTQKRFLSLNPYKTPELQRAPITELCLQTKQFAPKGTSIAEFLAQAIDPPMPDVTESTVNLLKKMEVLTENEELTHLGCLLLEIPVDPRFGKMIVYAMVMKCLDPILTIVSCLSNGELFKLQVDPVAKGELPLRRLNFSMNSLSDHLVFVNLFEQWQASTRKQRWCQDNFISAGTMDMIAGTKQKILAQLHVGNSNNVNQNARNWAVVKAAITAGLYPNIAKVETQRNCLRTPNEMKVLVHTSSVLKHGAIQGEHMNMNVRDKQALKSLPSEWVVFEESHQAHIHSNLRTCTVVPPLTVCLFAGPSQLPPPIKFEAVKDDLEEDDKDDDDQCGASPSSHFATIRIDDFIQFNADADTATAIIDLRTKLNFLVSNNMGQSGSLKSKGDEDILSAVASVLQNEDVTLLSAQPIQTDNTESRTSTSAAHPPGNSRPWMPRRPFRGRGYEERRSPQRTRPWEQSQPWQGNLDVPKKGRGRGRGRVQTEWGNSLTRENFNDPRRGRGRGRMETEWGNDQTRGNFYDPRRGRGRKETQWGNDKTWENFYDPRKGRGRGRMEMETEWGYKQTRVAAAEPPEPENAQATPPPQAEREFKQNIEPPPKKTENFDDLLQLIRGRGRGRMVTGSGNNQSRVAAAEPPKAENGNAPAPSLVEQEVTLKTHPQPNKTVVAVEPPEAETAQATPSPQAEREFKQNIEPPQKKTENVDDLLQLMRRGRGRGRMVTGSGNNQSRENFNDPGRGRGRGRIKTEWGSDQSGANALQNNSRRPTGSTSSNQSNVAAAEPPKAENGSTPPPPQVEPEVTLKIQPNKTVAAAEPPKAENGSTPPPPQVEQEVTLKIQPNKTVAAAEPPKAENGSTPPPPQVEQEVTLKIQPNKTVVAAEPSQAENAQAPPPPQAEREFKQNIELPQKKTVAETEPGGSRTWEGDTSDLLVTREMILAYRAKMKAAKPPEAETAQATPPPQAEREFRQNIQPPPKKTERRLHRFFLIKEGHPNMLREAFRRCKWPMTEKTGKEIIQAKTCTQHIYLFLALNSKEGEGGVTLHGYGKVLGQCSLDPLLNQSKSLTLMFNMEWTSKEQIKVDQPDHVTYIRNTPDGGEWSESFSTRIIYYWDVDYYRKYRQRRPLFT